MGDRRAAISTAIELASPATRSSSSVRATRQGRTIGWVVHPFDDRETVREILEAPR